MRLDVARGTGMEDALDELRRLVGGARELQPLSELLFSRLAALVGVATTSERLNVARGDTGADLWQERVFELLDESLAFLRREEERVAVLRLADVQRIVRLWRLNEQIDDAFRALDASGRADCGSDWASEWPRLVEELEQQMLEMATQRADLLVDDLCAPVDQREALAVVKHAFERLSSAPVKQKLKISTDKSPPQLQDHEELLRVLFRRLVTFTAVEVPALPTWFVSPGDIRIESIGGGQEGTASAHVTGSASTETLYAVWSRPDGSEQRVVLKYVSRDSSDASIDSEKAQQKCALVVNEASLLSSVRHPNVLRVVGGCQVSRTPFVMFECPAPPGEAVVTLDEYLAISVDHQRLALRLLAQAARGLQALHDLGLAHGDVRCANILVGDDHRAKLANLVTFSIVRVCGTGGDASDEVWSSDDADQEKDNSTNRRRQQLHKWQRQQRGRPSLRWQSPEVIAASKLKKNEDAADIHDDVRFAADIYALGICLVEALAGELPWGFLDDREVRKRVRAGELPPEVKALDENVKSLVEAMCDVNAAARPDIATVVDELEALAEEEKARDGVRNDSSKPEAARLHDVVPVKVGNRGSVSDGMAETMNAIPRRRQSDAPLIRATISGVPTQGFAFGGGSDVRHRGLSSPPSRVTVPSGDASPYIHQRRPSSTTSDISKYSKGTFGWGASDYDAASTDALNETKNSDDDEGDASEAFTTTVTLRSKWLGVKINSVGNRILLSKFLRAESGASGELEASRRVELGDEIVAVNGRRVRGALDRLQLGALVQSLPRPLELTFRRDPRALTSSFRFHGLRVDARWRDRGSALSLPGSLDDFLGTHHGQTKGFALEMWFSIADVREHFYLGGVLLGAQDVDVEATNSSAGSASDVWPYVHRALLVVDPSGALWCDLLATPDGPLVVATDLLPGQWYHLVLSYTGSSLGSLSDQQQQQQLVAFLDGEKRVIARGPLLPEWPHLRHVTLGTGCMSGVSPAKPTPNFSGWFGFSGLVHDLRVWHAPLSDVQSRQLFRAYGGRREGCAFVDKPVYSLKHTASKQEGQEDGLSDGSRAEVVKSTRPHHVVAQVYS